MSTHLPNTSNPNFIQSLFLTTFLLLTALNTGAQNRDTLYRINERMLLELPIFDYPFNRSGASVAAEKSRGELAGDKNVNAADWIRGLESPSMQQVLAVTKDLHATNYYFHNRLWNNWIPADNRKKFLWNRLAANATAGLTDYLLAYQLMVFGPVWLHEEFHRNGLTLQGISSTDDTYYRFTLDPRAGGSVSRVRDIDLIRFKAEAPQEMVRTFAAGGEGQYAFIRNLQKDNFFRDTDYPNVVMNLLLTNQAVNYVRQFQKPGYDANIDSMNYYGREMLDRDFVGWDFTAWVYDLHRPDEPYADRGEHPYGSGIDRIIKRSQLTPEEDAYLVKMGKLQYLNFLSPSMVGVHSIRLTKQTRFNFAVRHLLTSFGYDLGGDIFLDHRGQQWLIGIHTYHNREDTYAGLELERTGMQWKIGRQSLTLDARLMGWIQPEKAAFDAEKGKPGGLLGLQVHFPVGDHLSLYVDAEGKSDGWVWANPFLQQNLSLRTGISLDLP